MADLNDLYVNVDTGRLFVVKPMPPDDLLYNWVVHPDDYPPSTAA